jgi:hypothetical protein
MDRDGRCATAALKLESYYSISPEPLAASAKERSRKAENAREGQAAPNEQPAR